MNNTLFVYVKYGELGDVKVLDTNEALHSYSELLNQGYVHTATIDPKLFLRKILGMNANSVSFRKEINSLMAHPDFKPKKNGK